jgi:hypothetical protein
MAPGARPARTPPAAPRRGRGPADDVTCDAHLLIVHVFGSIALEVTDHRQPGQSAKDTDRLLSPTRTLTNDQARQLPRSAAAATVIGSQVSTQQYFWRLHRLLDGITATTAYRIVLAHYFHQGGSRQRRGRDKPRAKGR